jgi:putative membrane protein
MNHFMLKYRILLFLKGAAMGAADAVPGVSGGTIAFISGIYEELIQSLRSFDTRAVRLLMHHDIKGAWQHISGSFLTVLFCGIGTSLLIFSRLILFWMQHYPEMLWSFFFGLIIGSALVIAKKIPAWNMQVIISMLLGTGLGYFITVAVPAQTPETPGFVFFSGMIAICAMILPGISGSFILVLLSKYEYIFTAIKEFHLSVMLIFASGCAVGLLSFSHLLHWTLQRYRNISISALTGLMIGSLNKVWPWKNVLESYTAPGGKIKPLIVQNLLPASYLEITGKDPFLFYASLLAVFGFCLVYFLEKFSAEPAV